MSGEEYNTRQTLIQRLKAGENDEQSWEEFLHIYRPYIHAIIRNMNIFEHDADDLAQQVMIRLWKHISTYKDSPDKKFRSWLSTVTSNCVRDFIRKNIRDAERLEAAAADDRLSYLTAIRLPDIDRIADREWGSYITNMALVRIRDQFSGKAIQVFMLSLEGMEVEQISKKMKLKENSVYRLKSRVKKRLALEIKQLRTELE